MSPKATGEGLRRQPVAPIPFSAAAPHPAAPQPPSPYGRRFARRRLLMILFPAIDLKDGACVRLVKGDMEQATVYNENPGEQARAFMEMGFSWVHVVDLDGAVAGETANEEAVDNILWCVGDKAKVQLGGGIRDRATIDNWLEKGVARVILGTAAVRDPDLVREAARAYPGTDRRRHRRARRQGRDRGLDRDIRARGDRSREALRGRRRGGDHLHRHRPRRRARPASTGRRRSRSPMPCRSR